MGKKIRNEKTGGMQKIGANPTGMIGRLAGNFMNLFHSGQYRRIICSIAGKADHGITVLDIGCGGGEAISIFRSAIDASRICGIDHSADMVDLAKKVNKEGIAAGVINIVKGDVDNLPYPGDSFDLVTAFDTINFWNDTDAAFREINRILKQKGSFYIVNAYPKEGTKWWSFAKFKDDKEYRAALGNYFESITFEFMGQTIIIQSKK